MQKHRLYAKLEKCEFRTTRVGFVGFVITPNGVAIEEDRIESVKT